MCKGECVERGGGGGQAAQVECSGSSGCAGQTTHAGSSGLDGQVVHAKSSGLDGCAQGHASCGGAISGGESLRALLLTVRNHPGVMSHVCGLFARRAFNLEGIMVTPEEGGGICKMWLMVNEDSRMDQVVRQVRKLHDVLDVGIIPVGREVFAHMRGSLQGG